MYKLADLDPTRAPHLLPYADPAHWGATRERIRQVWHRYVGVLAEPEPVAWRTLDDEVLAGGGDGEEVRRLKISYDATPAGSAAAEPVPAYLLIPASAKRRPAPGALALHPTHQRGKDAVCIVGVSPNRHYGLELARRGYVVLAPDVIASGERVAAGEQCWDTAGFYRRSPGWTAIGRMMTDHRQSVSLLESLDEVDGTKIAAIGHSLGGYNAVFVAGLDERIRAVISSCGSSMWAGDPNPQRWFRGQLFLHLPRLADDLDAGTVPFEWHEIAALVAPRPFFVYSTHQDHCFPHADSIAAGMAEIKALYSALGAADEFEFLLGSGDHDFPTYIRHAAYAFLDGVLGRSGSTPQSVRRRRHPRLLARTLARLRVRSATARHR